MKPLHCLANVCDSRGSNLQAVSPHVCNEPFTWTSTTDDQDVVFPWTCHMLLPCLPCSLSTAPYLGFLRDAMTLHLPPERACANMREAQAQVFASESPPAESGPS